MPFPDDIVAAQADVRNAMTVVRDAQMKLRERIQALGKTIFEKDRARFEEEGITDHRDLNIDPDDFECDDPLNPVGTCIYGSYREDCLYCGNPSERK